MALMASSHRVPRAEVGHTSSNRRFLNSGRSAGCARIGAGSAKQTAQRKFSGVSREEKSVIMAEKYQEIFEHARILRLYAPCVYS